MQHPDSQERGSTAEAPTRRQFAIEVEPPFRLDLTAWALRRRPMNQAGRWDGAAYRRTLYVGAAPAEVIAVQTGAADAPRQ